MSGDWTITEFPVMLEPADPGAVLPAGGLANFMPITKNHIEEALVHTRTHQNLALLMGTTTVEAQWLPPAENVLPLNMMAESEWLTCTDPEHMLDLCREGMGIRDVGLAAPPRGYAVNLKAVIFNLDRPTQRQLRLLACGMARMFHVEQSAGHQAWVERVGMMQILMAEAFADKKASADELAILHNSPPYAGLCDKDAWRSVMVASRIGQEYGELIRDVLTPFGQPEFRPEWRTETVEQVARAVYTDRRWDEIGILHDALQEAGCTDPAIINHCCQSQHTRGCWLVDACLGW